MGLQLLWQILRSQRESEEAPSLPMQPRFSLPLRNLRQNVQVQEQSETPPGSHSQHGGEC